MSSKSRQQKKRLSRQRRAWRHEYVHIRGCAVCRNQVERYLYPEELAAMRAGEAGCPPLMELAFRGMPFEMTVDPEALAAMDEADRERDSRYEAAMEQEARFAEFDEP